jgi:hypothetical protein
MGFPPHAAVKSPSLSGGKARDIPQTFEPFLAAVMEQAAALAPTRHRFSSFPVRT